MLVVWVLVVWVLNHGYSNSTTVKVMYGLMSVSPFLAACTFAIASICSWTDFSTSAVSTFALSVEMLPATTCNNKT